MTVSQDRERRRSRFAHRTRHLRQHPRLLISSLAGVAIYLLLPDSFGQGTRLLAAFDLAAIAFLAAIWIMMTRATTADMRRRAQVEDEGRYVVLTLGATVASAILLAITFELHGLRDPAAGSAGGRVALAGLTILLAWFFMNTMFALHYAHFFYGDSDGDGPSETDARGLVFPGGKQPDYWDFLYFSFTIGMTFQVSDVQIESHSLRRTSLAHGVLAFFFNVVVLALTINIVAGLI